MKPEGIAGIMVGDDGSGEQVTAPSPAKPVELEDLYDSDRDMMILWELDEPALPPWFISPEATRPKGKV